MPENAIASALGDVSRLVQNYGNQRLATQELGLRAAYQQLQVANFQEQARQFDEELKLRRADINSRTVPLGTLVGLAKMRFGSQPNGDQFVKQISDTLDIFGMQPTDRVNAGMAVQIFKSFDDDVARAQNNRAEMERATLLAMTRMGEAYTAATDRPPPIDPVVNFSIIRPILNNPGKVAQFQSIRQLRSSQLFDRYLSQLPEDARSNPADPRVGRLSEVANRMGYYQAAQELGLLSDEQSGVIRQQLSTPPASPQTTPSTQPTTSPTTTATASSPTTTTFGGQALFPVLQGILPPELEAAVAEQYRTNAPPIDLNAVARAAEERFMPNRALAGIDQGPATANRFIAAMESGAQGPALTVQRVVRAPGQPPEVFIGHGHNLTAEEQRTGTVNIGGTPVNVNNGITEAQANALLDQDIQIAANAVSSIVRVPINENERTALISFVYNIGVTQFRNSRVLQLLNAGRKEEAFNLMKSSFTTSRGVTQRGLISRRQAESALALR